jgi:hypothetical protein
MTRAFARTTLLVALTCTLGGCTAVHVDRPVGDAAVTLDPGEWNGTWCDGTNLAPLPGSRMLSASETDCLSLTVVDASSGVLDVVDPSKPGEIYRAHLRHVGTDTESIFVTVEEDGAFVFEARARRHGAGLLAWDVSGDAIKEEIAAGRMPGRVDGDDAVRLDVSAPGVLARIASDGGRLFDWAHPLVLVRVSGS